MPPDGLMIGECVGCGAPIISGSGVTVDVSGGRWHPDCREKARVQDAPKRRGRPPKVTEPEPDLTR